LGPSGSKLVDFGRGTIMTIVAALWDDDGALMIARDFHFDSPLLRLHQSLSLPLTSASNSLEFEFELELELESSAAARRPLIISQLGPLGAPASSSSAHWPARNKGDQSADVDGCCATLLAGEWPASAARSLPL